MLPILDAHCHIYPDKIALKAAAGIGSFYDIPMDLDGRVDTLLREEQRAGITHLLVHSVATTPAQVAHINEFIASQVAQSGGCMTGFGALHPDSETIAEDVEHLIALGLKGVKIHPDVQAFALDSDKSLQMLAHLEGRLPVLIHTGDFRYQYSNPPQVKNLLRELPNLTVIGAHFGGWSMWEQATEELAGRYENFYVDCSSSFYALSPQTAKKLIERYGADRVLFGSDYPMWKPVEELQRFAAVGLSEREQRMVLYENGAKLLGLPL